jgi:hypothetical protein
MLRGYLSRYAREAKRSWLKVKLQLAGNGRFWRKADIGEIIDVS